MKITKILAWTIASILFMNSVLVTEAYINKDELRNVLRTVENRSRSDYSADSWKELETAKDYANAILEKSNDQTKVDNAITILKNAMNSLKDSDSNYTSKEALREKIHSLNNKVQSDYTASSWSRVESAKHSALSVLNNNYATYSEIKVASSNLEFAIDSLQRKDRDNRNNNYGNELVLRDDPRVRIKDGTYYNSYFDDYKSENETITEKIWNLTKSLLPMSYPSFSQNLDDFRKNLFNVNILKDLLTIVKTYLKEELKKEILAELKAEMKVEFKENLSANLTTEEILWTKK